MALAAANYALHAHLHNPDRWKQPWEAPTEREYQKGGPTTVWPWDWAWWKPKNPRRDLVRAAALIIAEIERLDRAAEASAAKAD